VALALPVLAAVAVGLALGGRLADLGRLELRAWWLFFAAIGLQLVAFPLPGFPWETGERAASALWLLSCGLLVVAAALNARVPGVPIVAAGMLLNLVAILANGGTMPVTPAALEAAGESYTTSANSTAMADPNAPWLVDRWAAPDWVPFANVFSVGGLVIAVGTFWLVLAAMGVDVRRRRDAVSNDLEASR
jgi:hypothetical protein